MQTTTEKKLLNLAEVRKKTTLSKTEIYRRIGESTFPEPYKIGPRRVAWLDCEVNRWIATVTSNPK